MRTNTHEFEKFSEPLCQNLSRLVVVMSRWRVWSVSETDSLKQFYGLLRINHQILTTAVCSRSDGQETSTASPPLSGLSPAESPARTHGRIRVAKDLATFATFAAFAVSHALRRLAPYDSRPKDGPRPYFFALASLSPPLTPPQSSFSLHKCRECCLVSRC